ISPLEYSKFYTMFGNYGVIKEPQIIKQVQDRNDQIIMEFNSNVSEEELKKGVEKFQKINEAYEKIKKHLEK
ncbi:penicillin-binding transpeptidase domain-containing protein, partial [Campylobacter coli]